MPQSSISFAAHTDESEVPTENAHSYEDQNWLERRFYVFDDDLGRKSEAAALAFSALLSALQDISALPDSADAAGAVRAAIEAIERRL